ncbi:MAG TPA: NUDIX domain-containing protein [Gaiellaceae bacterium]|nr:NUDIX domain-containing protein [Gaiellaceae bacterium]
MLEGATVVVRRGEQYLVLHRAVHDHDGDWAWGPPGGLRDEGETYEQTAARELLEETGLDLPLTLVQAGPWTTFVAEAPADADVVLSHEHDRCEWLPLEDACVRCLPDVVAAGIRAAS